MITNKEAVKTVVQYMKDIAEFMPSSDQRLEEIDYDDESNTWRVGVSFKEHSLSDEARICKRFAVDGDTAEVISMKNVIF
ncbi:MAG TPA: hypothetical protein VK446_06630 [Methylocystis sp.]|nr:hypothetical protein [Methylocystis sp.]